MTTTTDTTDAVRDDAEDRFEEAIEQLQELGLSDLEIVRRTASFLDHRAHRNDLEEVD